MTSMPSYHTNPTTVVSVLQSRRRQLARTPTGRELGLATRSPNSRFQGAIRLPVALFPAFYRPFVALDGSLIGDFQLRQRSAKDSHLFAEKSTSSPNSAS